MLLSLVVPRGFTVMCIQSPRWLLGQVPKGEFPPVFSEILKVSEEKQVLFIQRQFRKHESNVRLSKGKTFKRRGLGRRCVFSCRFATSR